MQQVTTGEKTYCFYIGNSIREQRKRKSRRNCSLWRGVPKYRKINLHVICHEHFLEEKGGGVFPVLFAAINKYKTKKITGEGIDIFLTVMCVTL